MFQDVVGFFADQDYCQMYYSAMKNMVKSATLLDECRPSAGYWYDIAASVNNIVVVKKDYLSQIFLDEQIHDIMKKAFSFESTPGFTRSMYSPEMETIAYGKK